MTNIKAKGDFLIEISYETVNLLGGVYAVLASKAKEIKEYYGDNYYLIGPYYKLFASAEFEEKVPPSDIKEVFEELEKEGIICHYGYWLIEGKPKTILVDFYGRLNKLNQIKTDMSKKYGIDLKTYNPPLKNKGGAKLSPWDFNTLLVWGDSTTKLIKKLLGLNSFKNKSGVLQFHTDAGKPVYPLMKDIKKEYPNVGSVITFHSTRLGRTIATNKEDLYKEVKENLKKGKKVNNKREYKYGNGVIPYHQFEALGAKNADVITAVSEVTAKEVEYIFGRKIDLVTPNGLDISNFPSIEERAITHNQSKQKIHRFLNAYFSPYYTLEVKDSLLFYTSGRYELTTKGYDILFDALGNLNKILKDEKYSKNIFVFLFIMTDGKGPNEEVLENLAIYGAIEHEIEKEFPHIRNKVMNSLVHRHDIKHEIFFDEDFLVDTKKLILKLTQRKKQQPPICAFKGLKKDDPLLKSIESNGLKNRKEDKIKIIFYPAPVSIADGLLSMDYTYVTSGMHLGVFPSLYEPWGYTSLEAIASSIMTVTTDASGFGKFAARNYKEQKKPGILQLKTVARKHDEIVGDLTKMMHLVSSMPRKERIERKLSARELASSADWKEFSKCYIEAYNSAIEKCKSGQKKK